MNLVRNVADKFTEIKFGSINILWIVNDMAAADCNTNAYSGVLKKYTDLERYYEYQTD